MLKYSIVLVPFPFDDLSSSKVQPAVCLTEPIGQHHHVVLAFISSREPRKLLTTDILISANEADFRNTGLHVSSVLRLHRMMTVTTNIIQRKLGQLSKPKQEAIQKQLKILFDLE